ncbi:MAG: hypothetical protein MGG37_11285 [Trichodesmium sp. MAG_R01]|nr:hypothetical protein [Trichodesmium sp. MAG_R01]
MASNSNDSINVVTQLGTLFPQTPITRLGTINDLDKVDLYGLTVDAPLNSGIALQNLTGNIDLQVLDNNGNLIARGNNLGTSNEAFQAVFSTPGQYFIYVVQTSPGIASDYELALFPRDANVSLFTGDTNTYSINNNNDDPRTPDFLGTLVPEEQISDSARINNLDRVDNYSFIAEQPLIVGVTFEKSNSNIEIAVLDSNRNLIERGQNFDQLTEKFQVFLPNPDTYNITIFQPEPVSDDSFSDYDLSLFPSAFDINPDIIPSVPPATPISPEPPTDPVTPTPLISPEPQRVNVSIDSIIDRTDEPVRNRENTAFVFKEDYLLNATPNTPITIDLISNNSAFDPLLEVYQIPQDSLLTPGRRQIPIAANDNGGNDINNVDARIGPEVEADIPEISSQLTLLPEFNYLVRVTYTSDLPLDGSFALSGSIDNGFVSFQKVLSGNPIGEIIGGEP